MKSSIYECRLCDYKTGEKIEKEPISVRKPTLAPLEEAEIARAEIARNDQIVIITPRRYVALWRWIKRKLKLK